MKDKEIIRMSEEKPYLTWVLEYVHDGDMRRTAYRGKSLVDAVNWLDEITDGKAYIFYGGLIDDED